MSNKKQLFIVLIVIVMIISFLIGLFIGKVNVRKADLQVSNNSIPVQIEITEVEYVPTNSGPKKYMLNQEEIYIMFDIIDNLTYSDISCDGMPTHSIRFYSEGKGVITAFSLEAYDSGYHISGLQEEARLSSEQTEQLSKIIDKLNY